jgi:hypothetical protein
MGCIPAYVASDLGTFSPTNAMWHPGKTAPPGEPVPPGAIFAMTLLPAFDVGAAGEHYVAQQLQVRAYRWAQMLSLTCRALRGNQCYGVNWLNRFSVAAGPSRPRFALRVLKILPVATSM